MSAPPTPSSLDAVLRTVAGVPLQFGSGWLYHCIARYHLTHYPVGPLHVPPRRPAPLPDRARLLAARALDGAASRLQAAADRIYP